MMNERIKQLMTQASTIRYSGFGETEILDPEKFAELIVQECVGVAIAQRDWVENMVAFSERDKFWNKARIVQSQRIVDKIKQHFGVK